MSAAQQQQHHASDSDAGGPSGSGENKKRKRTKRSMGKACVYCRRSHMVCEGGRPCERCIKRDIPHLCRDFSPPRQTDPQASSSSEHHHHSHGHNHHHHSDTDGVGSGGGGSSSQLPNMSSFTLDQSFNPHPPHHQNQNQNQNQGQGSSSSLSIDPSQINSSLPLYSDPNFPPAWPLLPDTAGPVTYGDVSRGDGGWGGEDQSELGTLSKYLGDLGVPNLPGGFLDVLSYFTKGGANNSSGVPIPGYDTTTPSGSATPAVGPQMTRTGSTPDFSAFVNNLQPQTQNLTQQPQASGSGLGQGQGQTEQMINGRGNVTGNGVGNGNGVFNTGSNGAMSVMDNANVGNNAMTASAAMTRVNSGGRASGSGTATAKGKGKEVMPLGNLSRIERYFLAAADQPTGPRSSRLSQVIKAKYDAGLLRPYDYVKGYERMKEWMDSGRAAPRIESAAPSAPGSPIKGGSANLHSGAGGTGGNTRTGAGAGSGLKPLTSTNTPITGSGGAVKAGAISADSRRRIWAAMNGFRPKFRQIARTLTEVDLVFIEEAMERWMLQYDRAFASIHTPSCIWRRTGEIQKANQEFANLTGIPASMFRNGQLCVYELMDEASAVRYWEGYAKIAFDAGQRSLYISCTLRIPSSLTRLPPRMPFATPTTLAPPKTAASGPTIPDLNLPQSLVHAANGGKSDLEAYVAALGREAGGTGGGGGGMDTPSRQAEAFREIKCCFSVTIRRDAWGVPVAIMGQWIPI